MKRRVMMRAAAQAVNEASEDYVYAQLEISNPPIVMSEDGLRVFVPTGLEAGRRDYEKPGHPTHRVLHLRTPFDLSSRYYDPSTAIEVEE